MEAIRKALGKPIVRVDTSDFEQMEAVRVRGSGDSWVYADPRFCLPVCSCADSESGAQVLRAACVDRVDHVALYRLLQPEKNLDSCLSCEDRGSPCPPSRRRTNWVRPFSSQFCPAARASYGPLCSATAAGPNGRSRGSCARRTRTRRFARFAPSVESCCPSRTTSARSLARPP